MAIVDLQRGIQEAGRIRIGQKVPAKNGSRPAKLDTFRLTSADRRRIEQAAEVYGGTLSEWDAPAGKQWQVITECDVLDVVVPPSDLSFSQHYELWSAGGCQRRCDGVTEQLSQGPCRCDPDRRECDIHTRLSVLLRDLPGLGVWRLDTQGYYAARELLGVVEVLQIAAGRGALLPARLRLDQRSVKRPGENGKPETRRFAVPMLDVDISPAQLLAGSAQPIPLEQAARPALTPVPQLPSTAPSIAEQSAPPPARTTTATEIPASGRTRRTRTATEQPAQGADSTEPEVIPAQAVDESASPAPASQPEADGLPPAVVPPADSTDPLERMVDLIRKAGKDPDAIRAQLGLAQWSDATPEQVVKLTVKAQETLRANGGESPTPPAADPAPAKRRTSRTKAAAAATEA